MNLAYIYHSACLEHDMGDYHPECPSRINAIEDQLKAADVFDYLRQYEAPRATIEQLARVHEQAHIKHVLSYSKLEDGEHRYLDPDTMITNKTPEAALRAAGALVMAVDLVMKKQAKSVFCCVRPPGHHALRDAAMGFCFFNNIAVGAAHAIAEYKLGRVAVIDFDVHHGNGTEEIFKNEPRVMLCSTFQHPFYPYCGAETQLDHIINVPLKAGASSDALREAYFTRLKPALEKFHPQMLFISAGFDAHADDDMSSLRFYDRDYAWITQELLALADRLCEGRIVSTLEGGYELHSLGRSVMNHVRVLMRMQ